jgi:hypothetical protein
VRKKKATLNGSRAQIPLGSLGTCHDPSMGYLVFA